jgi:hypothetical protein
MFDHTQHAEAISNIVRCQPTFSRQPEIAMAAYNRIVGRLCYFRLSVDIGDGTLETVVPENRG